jgi:protein required for attachment to host cells
MPAKTTTWLFVGDGAQAQFYAVHAIPLKLTKVRGGALKATRKRTRGPEHKPDSRHIAGIASGHGDHQRHENTFLENVATTLDTAAAAQKFDHLIVVLPPKALAHFRKILGAETRKKIKLEISSEWTHLNVKDIEKHLAVRLP